LARAPGQPNVAAPALASSIANLVDEAAQARTWTTVAPRQSPQDGALSAWETAVEPGLSVDGLFAQLGQDSEPTSWGLTVFTGLAQRSQGRSV